MQSTKELTTEFVTHNLDQVIEGTAQDFSEGLDNATVDNILIEYFTRECRETPLDEFIASVHDRFSGDGDYDADPIGVLRTYFGTKED